MTEIKKTKYDIETIIEEFKNKHQARCVVRPSNTEPILRIMVEDFNEQNAEKILNELIQKLKN